MRRLVIYLIGISFWIAFSAGGSLLNLLPEPAFRPSMVEVVNQTSFCLSFLIIAVLQPRLGSHIDRVLLWGSLLSLTLFLALGFLNARILPVPTLSYVAASFLGLSTASGYCLWTLLIKQFNPFQAKLLLALGSLASIATMAASAVLSDSNGVTIVACAILCPLAYILLYVNARISFAHDSGANSTSELTGSTMLGNSEGEESSSLMRSLLPLAACAMALVLIAPISSAAFAVWVGPIPAQPYIAPTANLCGLIVLSLIWFVFKKDLTLVQVYGVTLPLTVSLVIFSALFSPDFLWLSLFLGDACFLLVSVLTITNSLSLSREHHCSVVRVYAIIASCLYTSNVVQLVLDYAVRTGTLDGMQYMTVLLLLYIIMVPAFYLVSRTVTAGKEHPDRAEEADDRPTEPSGMQDPISTACDSIAAEHNLSPRQRELLEYFARGRDAAYIAKALFLSPHTVKSYRKTLYASLGIHNQQELIDLVEGHESKQIGHLG